MNFINRLLIITVLSLVQCNFLNEVFKWGCGTVFVSGTYMYCHESLSSKNFHKMITQSTSSKSRGYIKAKLTLELRPLWRNKAPCIPQRWPGTSQILGNWPVHPMRLERSCVSCCWHGSQLSQDKSNPTSFRCCSRTKNYRRVRWNWSRWLAPSTWSLWMADQWKWLRGWRSKGFLVRQYSLTWWQWTELVLDPLPLARGLGSCSCMQGQGHLSNDPIWSEKRPWAIVKRLLPVGLASARNAHSTVTKLTIAIEPFIAIRRSRGDTDVSSCPLPYL